MSLYQRLSGLQGDMPWGSVLDAGTGPGSMRWLLSLKTERWTAITGSTRMATRTREEIGDAMRAADRLEVGNWIDPDLLDGERYDTVLADYLLGAIDGFAPYSQDRLFHRLRPLVGRRLYIVGLEPYVPYRPQDPVGRIVNEIGRVRDACLLLAHERPYREYPMDWVLRHLDQAGFHAIDAMRIPIRYGERFVNSQLDMCSRAVDGMRDRVPGIALHATIAELRSRALAMVASEGGLRHGHDYIIMAEPRVP